MTPRAALRLPLGAGLALLPIAALLWLVSSQTLPAEARRGCLDLAGDWRLLPGDRTDGASATLDDSALPAVHVPGGLESEPFAGRGSWLRRRFQLPESLRDEDLFLVLGAPPGGAADLYLNGNWLGRKELNGRRGVDVSRQLLHLGENLLALRMAWRWPGSDGVDGLALMGPLAFKQAFLDTAEARRLADYGSASLMIFLVVLLGFIRGPERDPEARSLYLRCMALLASATLYLLVASAAFLPVVCWAWFNLFGHLLLGPRAALHRWTARVYPALVVAAAGGAALQQVRAVAVIHALTTAVAALLAVLLLGAAARRLMTQQKEVDVFTLPAVLLFLAAASTHLLRELGALGGMGFFPLAAAVSAISAAGILVARFTRVSFVNQELGLSLKRTNGELADALVKAQEASQLKSEFVANVSHELRTPLNSVLNIPEGLLEYFEPAPGARCEACTGIFELDPGEMLAADSACPGCAALGRLVPEDTFRFRGESTAAVRSLKQIHRAGNHLLNLINDVLDFSRLEAGRMVLKLEPLEVSTALEHVLETIQPIALPRRITLTLEATSGPPLVCDAVKFSQIFINLVGNAVKFSPEGGEVKVGGEPRDGRWLLWVKDQGIGIAPEHYQLIFESFRQVDGSTTRKYGGTGLGLAITRKLAEAHDGRVRVESVLQQGSTFLVELPFDGPLVRSAEETPWDGPPATVLLLDDEPLAIDNLKAALRPLRHRVHGITQPAELNRAIEQFRPDLLILDVMMPGVSGLDILKRLKASGVQMPILVSSAHHANREVVEVLGAVWLSKPWRGDFLRAEVSRLLRANQRPEEGSRRAAS